MVFQQGKDFNMPLIDSKRFADDYCKKMCAGGCSEQAKGVCEFMRLLNAQPVAFDTAAVMKELDMFEKESAESWQKNYLLDDFGRVCAYERAKKIVEGGVIDDQKIRCASNAG